MKYIRTEEGIYEVIEKEMIACPNDDGTSDVYYKLKSDKLVNRNNVIEQSDKLEELCDEFVRVNHYVISEPYLIRPLPRDWEALPKNSYAIALQEVINDQIEMKNRGDDFDIYGTIWTDKGLIYVAKMNNKGELELL